MSLLDTVFTCQGHAKYITTSAESTIAIACPLPSTICALEFSFIFFQNDCLAFDTLSKFHFTEISSSHFKTGRNWLLTVNFYFHKYSPLNIYQTYSRIFNAFFLMLILFERKGRLIGDSLWLIDSIWPSCVWVSVCKVVQISFFVDHDSLLISYLHLSQCKKYFFFTITSFQVPSDSVQWQRECCNEIDISKEVN